MQTYLYRRNSFCHTMHCIQDWYCAQAILSVVLVGYVKCLNSTFYHHHTNFLSSDIVADMYSL